MRPRSRVSKLSADRPVSIAILAMGGQGGGVLANWIVALAEANGWHAQSTSVPGVAQRTGATLYYIEMLPAKDGAAPILSLMPSPGDVDIVLAAEWMEAGRSILRGLVTPERTTLIASTHRALAVAEKEKPGNAIADSSTVTEATAMAAKRTVAFDMEQIAKAEGSVISAPLFGALAVASQLPFPVDSFRAVIAASGKGVEASLRAFKAGFDAAISPPSASPASAKLLPALPSASGHPQLDRLLGRIRNEFPGPTHGILFAGVRRLVDFQDPEYADEYLGRVAGFRALDDPGMNWRLTLAAAKHIAAAMAYDDVIAVADLKTRASRFDRLRRDIQLTDDQLVYATEYLRPRAAEVIGLLPAGLGAWVERHSRLVRLIDAIVNHGRRVETFTLRGFLPLYGLAGVRRWRRHTLRHRREQYHLSKWLDLARQHVGNYPLAVEILNARRLVKGYSGTHSRGLSKFDRVLGAVPLLAARDDGGDWLRRLITAALQDEEDTALDEALNTIRSFASP